MKTPVELIKETVAYYKTHKRGINDVGCAYVGKHGTHCAVGRCLTPQAKEVIKKDKDKYNHTSASEIIPNLKAAGVAEPLLPEYAEIDECLWEELQDFHDTHRNWEEKGKGNVLTSAGQKQLESLLYIYETAQ